MAEALAINTPNWLPLEEVCNLLNLSEKTVKNKCRNSEFNYKVEKKHKKCFYFISFNSLPEYYQNIYLYDESDAEPQTAYSDSPKWAKAQADKYLYIVKATRTLRGKELFEYIDNWNSKNPDLSIIAPMIETDYSLSKFVNTCLQIYNEELKDINLFINIETATAYNNLELILESPYIKYITGIVLGRDDMATSSNIDLNDINSDKMLFITNCIAEKVYKHNKKFIVGGCIRPDAIPFLKKIPQAFLSNYETRRVVFSADALQYDNVKDGLEKALEFEIKCIKTVSEFYNQDRINHLKEYLKPINLSAE